MKIYMLVEGCSSEMKAYPEWIKHFIDLPRHLEFEKFKEADNGFFIFSGYGYPSILDKIENGCEDIINIGNVDYFFIILDSDEDPVQVRKGEVEKRLNNFTLPDRTYTQVVVQNRCFETIILGNPRAIPRNPAGEKLREYKTFFDVTAGDPEHMGNYDPGCFTHSQFHADYAFKALREKRIRYSKSNCSGVANVNYFQNVIRRMESKKHLGSFQEFVDSMNQLKEKVKDPV